MGASQPISNGLLMLIRGNHVVISVLLSEISELDSTFQRAAERWGFPVRIRP